MAPLRKGRLGAAVASGPSPSYSTEESQAPVLPSLPNRRKIKRRTAPLPNQSVATALRLINEEVRNGGGSVQGEKENRVFGQDNAMHRAHCSRSALDDNHVPLENGYDSSDDGAGHMARLQLSSKVRVSSISRRGTATGGRRKLEADPADREQPILHQSGTDFLPAVQDSDIAGTSVLGKRRDLLSLDDAVFEAAEFFEDDEHSSTSSRTSEAGGSSLRKRRGSMILDNVASEAAGLFEGDESEEELSDHCSLSEMSSIASLANGSTSSSTPSVQESVSGASSTASDLGRLSIKAKPCDVLSVSSSSSETPSLATVPTSVLYSDVERLPMGAHTMNESEHCLGQRPWWMQCPGDHDSTLPINQGTNVDQQQFAVIQQLARTSPEHDVTFDSSHAPGRQTRPEGSSLQSIMTTRLHPPGLVNPFASSDFTSATRNLDNLLDHSATGTFGANPSGRVVDVLNCALPFASHPLVTTTLTTNMLADSVETSVVGVPLGRHLRQQSLNLDCMQPTGRSPLYQDAADPDAPTQTSLMRGEAVADTNQADSDDIKSYESFDGKITHVAAVEPQNEEQESVAKAIHSAVEADSHLVKSLLQRCETSSRLLFSDGPTAPSNGDVPLHAAARKGNMKALTCLLEFDKDSALIRNYMGYVALHQAVEHGHFAAVSAICARAPESARVQCEEGCLPLHEALSSAAHHEDAPQITATLLGVFPEAVNITTDEGLLPLHLAAMSGFAAGIRTIFAYSFDTIYAQENTEMMYPLDFAVDGLSTLEGEDENEGALEPASLSAGQNAGEESSGQELLSVARQQSPGLRTANTDRKFKSCIEILLMSTFHNRPILRPRSADETCPEFLPIHAAVLACPLPRSWKQLLSLYSAEFGSGTDNNGQTPMHLIGKMCASKDDAIVVNMICDLHSLNPRATSQVDHNGCMPLHFALLSSPSFEVVKALVDCNASAATVEVRSSSDGAWYHNMFPFQVAAATDCSLEVINLLLQSHPVGVQSGVSGLASCGLAGAA